MKKMCEPCIIFPVEAQSCNTTTQLSLIQTPVSFYVLSYHGSHNTFEDVSGKTAHKLPIKIHTYIILNIFYSLQIFS